MYGYDKYTTDAQRAVTGAAREIAVAVRKAAKLDEITLAVDAVKRAKNRHRLAMTLEGYGVDAVMERAVNEVAATERDLDTLLNTLNHGD